MAEMGRPGRTERTPVDIQSVLRDISKSWITILLLALSAAMLTYTYFSFTHKPEYTVKTTVVVSSQGADSNVYSNLSSAQTMAQTMSAILENSILKKTVSEELGLSMAGVKTTATRVPESNLLTLAVTADTPQHAFLILKSILKNYPALSDYVMPDVCLDTLQQPTISANSSNALPVIRYMEYAFIATILLLFLLFAVVSYFRDTVKNVREFDKKVDATLLGTIYHEKKKKRARSMLMTNPVHSARYVENYRMLASRIKGRMDRRHAKVLLVTSVLENEGKSTVAANIALALSQEQKKVLLMDCDFRKPAAYKLFDFNAELKPDLSDVVEGRASIEGLMKQMSNTSLYLAFCKRALSDSVEVVTNGKLKEIIDLVKQDMDYIVLDSPPMALVADSEELMKIADGAVLVVNQDLVYTQDINDALDALNTDEENGKVLGCVFNNVYPQFGDRYARGTGKADR